MKRYDIDTVTQLKQLRKKGLSIEQLVKMFSMPKTTVWHHVHAIKLTKVQRQLLDQNAGISSFRRKEERIQKAEKEAKIILAGHNRYLCSLLAMLHWAEGTAKEPTFTNTNSTMVRLYIFILEHCFNVLHERIFLNIRYFTGMKKDKCLNFWARSLKIPKKRIILYYNDGGNRGRTPYGICRILIRKGEYELKIISALIRLISEEVLAPVA